MTEPIFQPLLDRLGRFCIQGQVDLIENDFAPWVSPEGCKEELSKYIHEKVEEWGLESRCWPANFTSDIFPDPVDNWKMYFRKGKPPQLNSENFGRMASIRLFAREDDDIDFYGDLRFVIVRHGELPKLGYYEIQYNED